MKTLLAVVCAVVLMDLCCIGYCIHLYVSVPVVEEFLVYPDKEPPVLCDICDGVECTCVDCQCNEPCDKCGCLPCRCYIAY